MSDWQIGDLAVCVELNPQSIFGLGGLCVGGVYTVTRAYFNDSGTACLALAEVASEHPDGGYQAFRFRKIRPDEHQGNAEDWQLLRETHKHRVSA